MPSGFAEFAFTLARISLLHKQLMHLPLGLLHSHEQEKKGFALLQIEWRVLYEIAFLLGQNLQSDVGHGEMGGGCMPVPVPCSGLWRHLHRVQELMGCPCGALPRVLSLISDHSQSPMWVTHLLSRTTAPGHTV